MNAPLPPPSPLFAALGRAAVASRWLAATLVTATSVRFAVASLDRVSGTTGPSSSATATIAASPSPPLRPTAPPSASAVVHPGAPRSIQLGISAGPGRSEIHVNGRLLGNTPFVGDTSCKTGMPLRIELVPPSGPPWVYDRECRGSMIVISGPPP